jgi:hypothetical protein
MRIQSRNYAVTALCTAANVLAIRDADYDTLYIGGQLAMVDGVPSVNSGRRYFQPIAPQASWNRQHPLFKEISI